MSQVFEFLNQGWVGTAVGTAGLFLALVLYWRARAGGVVAMQYTNTRLVGGGDAAFPDEVTIRFRDHEVPRVTSTRLVVWNAGRKTVRGADIVEVDPVRITIQDDAQILKAEVAHATRSVNAVALGAGQPDDASLLISFDFLDPGDGAVIEVLHTGPAAPPVLAGTIRSIPHGLQNRGRDRTNYLDASTGPIRNRVLFMAAMCAGLAIAGAGVFYGDLRILFPAFFAGAGLSDVRRSVLLIGAGLTYAAMPLTLFWMARRRYPAALLHREEQPESATDRAEKADTMNH